MRQPFLKAQLYFDCKCLACKNNYPEFILLSRGTVAFTHLNTFGRFTNICALPEQDLLFVYQEACQYLRVHGGEGAVNQKLFMVQEVLKMYFNALINNWPLKWRFGHLEIC